jgi:hypothetical protein
MQDWRWEEQEDWSAFHGSYCECGRTQVRLRRVAGGPRLARQCLCCCRKKGSALRSLPGSALGRSAPGRLIRPSETPSGRQSRRSMSRLAAIVRGAGGMCITSPTSTQATSYSRAHACHNQKVRSEKHNQFTHTPHTPKSVRRAHPLGWGCRSAHSTPSLSLPLVAHPGRTATDSLLRQSRPLSRPRSPSTRPRPSLRTAGKQHDAQENDGRARS